MANIVQVILQGDDVSRAAFDSATAAANKFKTATRNVSAELGAGKAILNQFASVASGVGAGSLATMALEFAHATSEAKQLNKELAHMGGTATAAKAALAGLVAVVGFKAGSGLAELFGLSGEFLEKETAFSDAMAKIQQQTVEAKAALNGSGGLTTSLAAVNEEIDKVQRSVEAAGAFDGPSWLGGTEGQSVENVEAMVGALRNLRDIIIQTNKEASDAGTLKLWQQLNAKGGNLIRSSSFGGAESGGRSYTKYTPEQGQQLNQMQAYYDDALAQFKKFTDDKDAIAEFAAATEKARAQSLKDFEISILKEEAKERQRITQAILSATAGLFGSLANLAAAQGKKGFELAQAFRYAEAIVSTAAGVARALAEYAWPYSIVVGGLVAAAGAVQLATIASAKPPKAHGGLENVPREAIYQLSQGERVIAPGQNSRLERMIEDWEGGSGGGRSMHVSVMFDGTVLGRFMGQLSRDGRLQIDARALT